MALVPIDENHAQQIQAGQKGRRAGHRFEDELARGVNAISWPFRIVQSTGHVAIGHPSELLLHYIAQSHLSAR